MNKFLLLATLLLSIAVYGQDPDFQLTHKGSVYKIKFSPDGSRLLSYSSGNQDLCMWDVTSGRLLWKRPISFIQEADENYTLNALSWSPDKNTIATGSGNGSMQLWDASTGALRWFADVGNGGVADIAFNPNGKTVAATPYSDSSVAARNFDVTSGNLIMTFAGADCERIAVAFASDGRELMVGDLNGGVSSWDLKTGTPTNALSDCKSQYSYAGERVFSDDLSLSFRRTDADNVQIERSNGTPLKKMALNSPKFVGLIDSKTQKAIKYEYGGYRLLDLASGSERLLDDCVSGSAFDLSQDGKLFARSCDGFRTAIKVTDLEANTDAYLDGHPSKIHSIRYSPDFTLIGVAGNDGNAYLFVSSSKALKKVLKGSDKRLTALAFLPDGKRLITGDERSTLHSWDISSGRQTRSAQLGDRYDDVNSIDISRDGEYILVTINGNAYVLGSDLQVLVSIHTADGYESTAGSMTIGYGAVPITSAVFSGDSSMIVTGHADGSIRTWDILTGAEIRKFAAGDRVLFLDKIVGSPGQIIALINTKDKVSFRLIDTATGRSIKQSRNVEASYAEKFSVSPDGRIAAVTDISGDAIFCDLRTMQIRELPVSKNSGEDSIAFSRDSKTFFMGGADQNLSLYETATLKPIWRLLPDFVPSPLENKMRASRVTRLKKISEKKKQREMEAAHFVRTHRKSIYIKFDHFGEMSDPAQKRMVESPIRNDSKLASEHGNAVWLKLHNDSSLPISVPTESMYFPEKDCFHTFPNGERILGLCEDREVSVRFSVEDTQGKSIPFGFDFGSQVILLPGKAVLFPIPRSLWEKNYVFAFGVSFQNIRASENDREMDFGEEVEIRTQRTSVSRPKH